MEEWEDFELIPQWKTSKLQTHVQQLNDLKMNFFFNASILSVQ